MPKSSAGILLHRLTGRGREVLLVHPGGPFWRRRDAGTWMIPKGEIEPGETPAAAALREFAEELGSLPAGTPAALCRIRQAGGKWVDAFALEGDFDPSGLVSSRFTIEYPPKSGKQHSFPEVDRAAWLTLAEARVKMLPSQAPILDALERALGKG